MLEKMLITDFQKHERLLVEFDPKITTITGPTDSGKSSILRALRWLMLNRPSGDGFVRWGQKSMTVKAKVDGRTIKRARGKGNTYSLDGEQYEAFGTGVPDAISGFLNVGATHFVLQHDPPFWFSLSPPEVARQLNKIVDLGAIDEVTSKLAAKQRKLNAERDVCQERLDAAKRTKTELSYVLMMDRDLKGLEGLRSSIDDQSAANYAMDVLLRNTKWKSTVIAKSKSVVDLGKNAVDAGEVASGSSKDVGALSSLLEEVGEVRKALSTPVPSIDALTKARDLVVEGEENVRDMRNTINLVKCQADELVILKAELKKAGNRLKVETGGRCPVCGGVMA